MTDAMDAHSEYLEQRDQEEADNMRNTIDAPPPEQVTRTPEDYLREALESNPDSTKPPSYYQNLFSLYQRNSYIVLQAYRLEPGEVLNVGFSDNLRFVVKCAPPTVGNDPQWRQFTINEEWVGNVWGMEKTITAMCFDEFMGILVRSFLKSL